MDDIFLILSFQTRVTLLFSKHGICFNFRENTRMRNGYAGGLSKDTLKLAVKLANNRICVCMYAFSSLSIVSKTVFS